MGREEIAPEATKSVLFILKLKMMYGALKLSVQQDHIGLISPSFFEVECTL